MYDFKPTDYEFEAEGGQYSFPYTAEAALVATPDEYAEGWLTVEVTETEVVLKAEANTVVKTRSSIVEWTIGSAKGEFEVSQKGAPATFEGEFAAVNAPVGGTTVVYEYTTNSELVVSSKENWIETYTEDSKLYIIVASNSGKVREGSVSWSVRNSDKSGDIAVTQAGSIFSLETYPYDYDDESTSADTFLTRIQTSGVATSIKRALILASGIEGADYATLLAYTRQQGSDMTQYAANFANAAGYGIISGMTSAPDTPMAVLVYVKIGDVEEVQVGYVRFTKGEQNKSYSSIDLQPAATKSAYYGEYHVIFDTPDEGVDDWMGASVQGNLTITDGEATVTTDGQTVELLKISGLWNTQFNARVTFDDAMYYRYIDGLIYSVDQELGVLYLDGSQVSDGNLYTLTVLSDDKMYETTGALVGGLVTDDGCIAFIGSVFEGSLSYESTWLVEDSGYWAIAKDFFLIPSGRPLDQISVAAAQKKLSKIKAAMAPAKGDGSYVQRFDSMSFKNALNKVNAAEAATFAGTATYSTNL